MEELFVRLEGGPSHSSSFVRIPQQHAMIAFAVWTHMMEKGIVTPVAGIVTEGRLSVLIFQSFCRPPPISYIAPAHLIG
jgi:hypothetical protein